MRTIDRVDWTPHNLDRLIDHAFQRRRPLSLWEYRYLRGVYQQRLIRGWTWLVLGFGFVVAGGFTGGMLGVGTMFGGAAMNIYAAELLYPMSPKPAPVKRGIDWDHRQRLSALERLGT